MFRNTYNLLLNIIRCILLSFMCMSYLCIVLQDSYSQTLPDTERDTLLKQVSELQFAIKNKDMVNNDCLLSCYNIYLIIRSTPN